MLDSSRGGGIALFEVVEHHAAGRELGHHAPDGAPHHAYPALGDSAVVALVSTTFGLAAIIRRLLGDPFQEQYTSLVHDLGFPIALTIVFVPLWLFHRRVVEAEAARETELARAAAIRRAYTYGVAAFGLAMSAIGAAGTIGVFGSQLMGMNTHPNGETATYLALVLVGLPAWGFHWWQAQRRLDPAERTLQISVPSASGAMLTNAAAKYGGARSGPKLTFARPSPLKVNDSPPPPVSICAPPVASRVASAELCALNA